MSRKAVRIEKDNLRRKIEEYCISDWGSISITRTRGIDKDLAKVQFDSENIDLEECDYRRELSGLMGYVTLPNGLTFLGGTAGGDWECPVYFIVYFDGKRLRGYVPEDGNTFCKRGGKKFAYGNEDTEADDAPAWDAAKLLADIESRITVDDGKPSGAKGKTQVAKPSMPEKTERKPPEEVILGLVFYGCGDEAYELWRDECILCNRLWGLNYEERAYQVLEWIIEDAKRSKEWCEKEYGSLDNADSERGVWGD